MIGSCVGPEVEQVGAQRFGGQHVEGGEGLVHQEDGGFDDQCPGEADALAHAAGQFARIGRFEAVEADQVDGVERTACGLPVGGHRSASRPSFTFSSTVSQGNSAKVWNTMAAPSTGPVTRCPGRSRRRSKAA